ncbi:GmrSD restriction endonuclease domain-containing protein [Xylanimonas protaetiae]|uniref:GmrSD restriction endonuclease domain-containing protein n=1 Tax=Xylanimonas protaetiae TaxID=2509457 RepID=UPI001F5C90B0|nr:DUF1524 domain-containing protein [Xylanimonas protaetiae]
MNAARSRRRPPWWAVLSAVVVGIVVAVGSAHADDDAAPVPSASATLAVTDAGSPTSQVPAEPQQDEPAGTPVDGPTDASGAAPAGGPTDGSGAAPAGPQADAPAAQGSALAAVAELAVKGRAPKTGYSRDAFGPAWADVDRNGCDTRNDVLHRDLVDVTTRPGTHGCVVQTGTLHDPYSGEVVAFERGETTSSLVQIDHVVALSDAWQKGAQQWTPETRRQLANDPLNLRAVKGSLNSQKGDGDAATWLPPSKAYRCAYVARQVAVKHAYGLWVTEAERDAMVRVLSACPDEPLPTGGPEEAPAAPVPPPAALEPAPAAAPEAPAGGDVSFQNCAAARAAGAAPLHRGDPGYRSQMDGDDDGVACE